MKHLAATVFLAIVTTTTTGLYAMGTGPVPNSGTTQTQGQPVDIGPQDTALHRPTPAPQASATPSGKPEPMSVGLYKDEKGKQPASVFGKTDPEICLKWTGGMGGKGDKVRVAWYAVDTGGAIAKNKKITESNMTLTMAGQPGSSYISSPKGGFPAGSYRVDVYEGAKVSKSLKFTVK